MLRPYKIFISEESRRRKRMTTNPYIGSSLDDLLEEDGILEEVDAIAIKRVLAWQVSQLMQEKGLTKTTMAQEMNTSRASLDRLLDPENTSVTLNTMVNAAKAVGKRLRIELM